MKTELLSCIFVCLAGILISLISIPFFTHNIALRKKCDSETIGKIVDYKIKKLGDGKFYISPIAEFYADGNIYTAYRHYKGIANKIKVYNVKNNEYSSDSIYVSDNDIFYVNKNGNRHNFRELAYKKWPIDSEMKVFYNPKNPKQAFAEKIVTSSIVVGIVLLCVGLGIMIVSGAAALLFLI